MVLKRCPVCGRWVATELFERHSLGHSRLLLLLCYGDARRLARSRRARASGGTW
jgi:hypothetical protein